MIIMKPPFLPFLASAGVALCALFLAATASAQVSLTFVTVGNPGNANDTSAINSLHPLGAVSYSYKMSAYDVTLAQYATFLNAVAKTDTYLLYNTNLGTYAQTKGIARAGISGSYSYTVIGTGTRPVTWVSWFNAARFANWMCNGQPTGAQGNATTETGAYTLNGANSGVTFTKNAGATYWIPSENEWYKAAYYDTSIAATNKYWAYPTRSNSVPGNVVGNGTNMANFNNGRYSTTQSTINNPNASYLTPVGAFTSSASAYGTFDQGGNVWQWTDQPYSSTGIGDDSRTLWGGAFNGGETFMQGNGNYQITKAPESKTYNLGFRLAATALSAFQQWLQSNSLPTDGTGTGSPTATPAGDGVANLIKYALGQSAGTINQSALPSSNVALDYLTLSYTRPEPAPAGITYIVEASGDLQTWSANGTVATPGPVLNGARTTAVRDSLTVSAQSKRFLRLRITMP